MSVYNFVGLKIVLWYLRIFYAALEKMINFWNSLMFFVSMTLPASLGRLSEWLEKLKFRFREKIKYASHLRIFFSTK
jgi:hypothetical protein